MAKKGVRPARSKKSAKKVPDELIVRLLVLCDGAARDPTSKKSTLYGLFDVLVADTVPADARFTLYAKIHGQGKHAFHISVLDPSGKSVFGASPSAEVELPPEKNAELVVTIVAKVKRFGEHSVVLYADNKQVGSVPLVVVKRKE